ncbi:2-hydroxycarboxylate transporter family protein [Enterocloster lavalensis]|uniref:2-hydroxycarboxylate transporter family protein n=1 Tax=Enterocloster lavalensis TaxID=460384 RepID=UPI0023F3F4A7|nr:2-hydroxycarboxylate transporter family protein [Enterocloster lavalensis]
MLEKLKSEKILGIPLWLFTILTAATLLIAKFDYLPYNLAGMLAFSMIVGAFLGYIGDKIPVWNAWFGGGIMLTWIIMSAVYTFNWLPESAISCIVDIGIDGGWRDFFIVVLVVGSICTVNRKILLKSIVGFIPTCVVGLLAAILFGMGAALIVGVDPIRAMIYYALPVMGGGTGAGAVPMSEMFAAATGQDSGTWFGPAFAALCVADSLAIILASSLNVLGKKFPKLSGYPSMMRPGKKEINSRETVESAKAQMRPATVEEYALGLAFAVFMYIVANFYSKISLINNAGLGFSIHAFAWLVIFMAVLIGTDILPEKIKVGCAAISKFFAKYMVFAQMIIMGCASSLYDFGEMLLPKNLFIITMVMIGAIIGTGAFGYLLGFYPVEIAMTAGLCQANAGNSGDLMTLSAGKRLDLLAFSSVATRIGGAITLVIASILFGFFA